MPLNAPQKALILRADPKRVTTELGRLIRFWRLKRWLGTNNRYAKDTLDRIKADTLPAGSINHGHLAHYIAASSITHCMDGWSYAARAMEAELSGDFHAARHLAYYAELRAALAILAGQGLGAFHNKHIVLTANGNCELLKGAGTHEFVWDALEYWAEQPAATNLVLEVINPGGVPLGQWLDHFAPAGGAGFRALLAKQWLLEWGLDLSRFPDDRDARNESSYRPTTMARRKGLSLEKSLDYVEGLWRAHEPYSANPFGAIDRYLLRRSFAHFFMGFDAQHRHPKAARLDYERLLAPVLHNVLPTYGDFTEDQWKKFLTFRSPFGESPVFSQAEKRDSIFSPGHHIQVISRAAILLRFATGVARLNLKKLPAADVSQLGFWWEPLGESRGLWEKGYPPTQFADLWQDIDDALMQLAAWKAAGGATRRGLFARIPETVRALSSCERVAMWTIGV